MATRKTTKVSATPKQPTAAEMRNWYEQHKTTIENFDKAKSAENMLTLTDVTKTNTRTISVFDKDKLRSYFQSIGSNEKNIRNLSRYLFYRCQAYYRLIMYNAGMFCPDARSVIPEYNPTEDNTDDDSMLKDWYDTLTVLDNLNLNYEFLKAAIVCFREDVYYGCIYYDETGMFVLPLDPDYCKISGIYPTGDFAFVMDMSYFRSRQTTLELWGEPFTSMYKAYENDTSNGKWQPMPDENAMCFKQHCEDWDLVVPPFAGLLNSIINLIDVEDVQAIADQQEIYKMIFLEMETLTGSKQMNDWKVDPKIMVSYFNRMISDALPDYVTAAIVPGELKAIKFDENDKTKDTNKVVTSTNALFTSACGAQILGSTDLSGTEAFTAAIKSDTQFALSSLLPQFQSWTNRFLKTQLSNPAKVKYLEVSTYTKDWLRNALTTQAEYSMPVKLTLNTLNGFSEKDTLALAHLENKILNLADEFQPLSSSHTQSGSTTNIDSNGNSTPTSNAGSSDSSVETKSTKKSTSK